MTTTSRAPTPAEAVKILRDALREVRHSLQFINDTPGGAITDTLWMMHQPETVFDHIDTALALTADASEDAPDDLKSLSIADDDAYALGTMTVARISRHDAIAFANAVLFHAARPAPVGAVQAVESEGAEPSWRTADISWACMYLTDNTSFNGAAIQREWNAMKSICLAAAPAAPIAKPEAGEQAGAVAVVLQDIVNDGYLSETQANRARLALAASATHKGEENG